MHGAGTNDRAYDDLSSTVKDCSDPALAPGGRDREGEERLAGATGGGCASSPP